MLHNVFVHRVSLSCSDVTLRALHKQSQVVLRNKLTKTCNNLPRLVTQTQLGERVA